MNAEELARWFHAHSGVVTAAAVEPQLQLFTIRAPPMVKLLVSDPEPRTFVIVTKRVFDSFVKQVAPSERLVIRKRRRRSLASPRCSLKTSRQLAPQKSPVAALRTTSARR